MTSATTSPMDLALALAAGIDETSAALERPAVRAAIAAEDAPWL